MAHFAKLGLGNKIIRKIRVNNTVITDEDGIEQESLGVEFLRQLYNDPTAVWKQYSYNTRGGVHKLGGTPFRKNAASEKGYYDEAKDAFIPQQPYSTWTLNETTCLWEAPVAYPDDGEVYQWNISTSNWEMIGEN